MLKSVLKLSSAASLAQLAPFLAVPILARDVSPVSFGYLGTFVALIAVFSVLSTLRLEPAIVLEKDRPRELTSLIRFICLIFSGLAFPIALTYCLMNGIEFLVSVCFLVALFCYSSIKVSLQYLNSMSRYSSMSFVNISLAVFVNAIHLLFVFVLDVSDPFVLIYSYTIGICSVYMYSTYLSGLSYLPMPAVYEWSLVKTYSNFVKYELPSDLTFQASQFLPVVIVTLCYGAEMGGLFSVAEKLVMIPVAFVAGAIGTVLFKEYSDRVHLSESRGRSQSIFAILILLTVIGALVYALFIDAILAALFDESYSGLVDVANYLVAYSILIFLSSPFSSVLWKAGKQKVNLWLSFSTLLVRVVFFYILSNSVEVHYALIYIGLVSLLPRIFLQAFCFRELSFSKKLVTVLLAAELAALILFWLWLNL